MNRPKRKAGMGYIVILLLILIVFAVAGIFVSRRFAPSKAETDLLDYYNLTAYESLNRPAAGADELAVVIDDKILDNKDTGNFRAVRMGGEIYIAVSVAQEWIDNRFYVDKREGVFAFTDALHSITSYIDSTTYFENGTEQDAGYPIARYVEETPYVSLRFVAEHSTYRYQVLDNPARVYIQNENADFKSCTAKVELKMRTSDSKKSEIVTVVPKDTKMKVLSEADGWYKVIDARGYIGYVQNNFVSEVTEESTTSDYQDPEYTHITLDGNVNLVWHGIYYYESNYYVGDYTADMTGVNVLAPTWFLFADTEGDLISYAEQGYVDYAHQNGWQVWAVLEDMDGESCEEILPYTSKRQYVINQMIGVCQQYGIDGINVDLETVTSDIGNDFIQFIRELSVACRSNGLVLSVDDYAPYSYNAYRHTYEQSQICDYVAVMAYDDYVGGTEAGPNASVPFVNEVMELCKENVEDMSRLIVGLPFYTRVWYEYEDGTLGTEGFNMGDVEDIAWEHGLTFNWQQALGYDYAEYEEDGARVRLWYENAKSLEAKLQTISNSYDVAGIAAWRLGQETSDVWPILSKYY